MSLIPPDLPPLWASLAAFGAGDTDAALEHLLRSLATHVQAPTAYWLGAVRMQDLSIDDPLNGWRPIAIRYLTPLLEDEKFFRKSVAEVERGAADC